MLMMVMQLPGGVLGGYWKGSGGANGSLVMTRIRVSDPIRVCAAAADGECALCLVSLASRKSMATL